MKKDYFKEDFVRIGLFFPRRQFDTYLNGTMVSEMQFFLQRESFKLAKRASVHKYRSSIINENVYMLCILSLIKRKTLLAAEYS